MDSFWDFFWFTVSFFLLMAYLLVMFQIVVDIFRDRDSSGWVKAAWILFLIVLPVITALVYLIARGSSMTERSIAASSSSRQQTEDYIRSVAGPSSPVDEIARAKELLDSGAITPEEFERLKGRAMA